MMDFRQPAFLFLRTEFGAAADDLTGDRWEPLATLTLTTSPRVYVDWDSAGKARRFYRAVWVE